MTTQRGVMMLKLFVPLMLCTSVCVLGCKGDPEPAQQAAPEKAEQTKGPDKVASDKGQDKANKPSTAPTAGDKGDKGFAAMWSATITLDGDAGTKMTFEGGQTMSVTKKVLGTGPKSPDSQATLTLWHDVGVGAGTFDQSYGMLVGKREGNIVSCASPRKISSEGQVTGKWTLQASSPKDLVELTFSGPVKCGRTDTGTINGWAKLRRPKGWTP